MSNDKPEFKQLIHARALELISNKIEMLESAMQAAQEAANSQTKSSAGDKHETGRAMAQLEKEQKAKQLQDALKLKAVLARIDSAPASKTAQLGSLVQTESMWIYLSVGLGIVDTLNQKCFVVSPVSPLGKNVLGKSRGDELMFQGKKEKVVSIL